MKADHVAFQVSDLDRALQFYSGELGLKLLFRELDREHHEAFAFLELQGAQIELLQALDKQNRPVAIERKEARAPYCPHVAITTDNMDQLLAALRAKGIPILKGPLEIPGKVRWLYIADPDNNVVEFVQWM